MDVLGEDFVSILGEGEGTLLRRGFVGGMTQPGAADTGAYLYCLPELDDRLALDASDSR